MRSNLDNEAEPGRPVKSNINQYRASIPTTSSQDDSKINALADLHRGKVDSKRVAKYFSAREQMQSAQKALPVFSSSPEYQG